MTVNVIMITKYSVEALGMPPYPIPANPDAISFYLYHLFNKLKVKLLYNE